MLLNYDEIDAYLESAAGEVPAYSIQDEEEPSYEGYSSKVQEADLFLELVGQFRKTKSPVHLELVLELARLGRMPAVLANAACYLLTI